MTGELILILVGLFVGIIAGMSGTGGGVLMVPALVFLLPFLGMTPYNIQPATGISAMQALFGALAGMMIHWKKAYISFSLLIRLIPGSIAGGLLGGMVSGIIPSVYIYGLFAMILLICLLQIWLINPESKYAYNEYFGLSWGNGFIIGILISFLAANTGLGGAILLLPVLIYLKHVPVRQAIGTGASFVVVTSFGSVIGKYLMNIVPLPDAVWVSVGALAGGILGSYLSHCVSISFLRKFITILVLIAFLRIIMEIYRIILVI